MQMYKPLGPSPAAEMQTPGALVLVFVLGAARVDASESRELLKPSRAHPGKCFEPHMNLVISPDSKIRGKNLCVIYSCEEVKDGFELIIDGCPEEPRRPGCRKVAGNLKLDFPECCERVICNV